MTSTESHDPGVGSAAVRAMAAGEVRADPIEINGAIVTIGTAGWTDPLLIKGGAFYPEGVTSAEDRLRYYASRFSMVEVDASYYALPTREMAEAWVERTPDDFLFDIKAHALMTGHPTETKRLPPDLREALPEDIRGKSRLYATDLPAELYDDVWRRFTEALLPLDSAGKLGAVLLQFPPWFVPTKENSDLILDARRRLEPYQISVEFRRASWLEGKLGDRTVEWLAEHRIALVIADTPPDTGQSVPRRVAVTNPALTVVRLHGRRSESWAKKGVSVSERFRYLYSPEELQLLIPDIQDAGREAKRMHVVFNNCYGNYGTTNAAEMWEMLKIFQ